MGVAPGRANAADTPVAVLGIEADNSLEAVASSLTEALRQKVSSAKGFRLVPGRDLVEVKLVFSCPDEAPSCMAQAAKSLGASKLIFGSVKKAGDENSYLVTLKLLDAAKGVVDAWAADQVSRAQMSGPAIKGPVQKWFSNLTGQGAVGVIRVRGDVVGATVALDGVPVGVTGPEDLVIPGVNAGKHELTATKAGMDTYRTEVDLRAGETEQVVVSVGQAAAGGGGAVVRTDETVGVAEEADEPPHPKRTVRAAGWGTLGAALLSAGLGVKFSLDVKKANDDLDPLRRYECKPPVVGAFGCMANGTAFPAEQTATERSTIQQKLDDGDRAQKMQYVFYGVGGALAVTSGYLLYRGYLADDGEAEAAKTGTKITLIPSLGRDGAGGALHLQF